MRATFKSGYFQVPIALPHTEKGILSVPSFAHTQYLTATAEEGAIGTRAKRNRRKYIN